MRTDKQNKKARTYGLTAVLAMLAILVGASVSASLEQFAAPTLSLTDPYYSIVDDATGVEDGGDMGVESEDGLRDRMAKMIRHRMPEQMQEHEERNSEALQEHLQQRIAVGNELLAAFEFCEAAVECTVDSTLLDEMEERLNARIEHLELVLANPEDESLRGDEQRPLPLGDSIEDILQAKLDRVNTILAAVDFCLVDENCDADSGMLGILSERLQDRADHIEDCLHDGICKQPERDGEDRRSLSQRFRHHMRGGHEAR